jgi:hypothetical protein
MVYQNFPGHFPNNRQPVSAELSCGSASTFVLTANTGTSRNAQSLVLMIEFETYLPLEYADRLPLNRRVRRVTTVTEDGRQRTGR